MNYADVFAAFLIGFITTHLTVLLLSFLIWGNLFKNVGYSFVLRMSLIIGIGCSISTMVAK
jgi:hypothetical protein